MYVPYLSITNLDDLLEVENSARISATHLRFFMPELQAEKAKLEATRIRKNLELSAIHVPKKGARKCAVVRPRREECQDGRCDSRKVGVRCRIPLAATEKYLERPCACFMSSVLRSLLRARRLFSPVHCSALSTVL
nr:hypothetical protein CFP56_44388 [Quercus suber]